MYFLEYYFVHSVGNRLAKKTDNRCKNIVIRYICDNNYRYKVGIDKKKCCNSQSIREQTIEEYLLQNLESKIKNYKFNYSTKKEISKKDNSQDIARIEKKISKLKDLYLDDLISKDSYKKDYEKLNEELINLKNSSTIEIKKDFSKFDKILNTDYKNIYSNLSQKNKKKFWLNLIDKIYISNGEIEEIAFL